MIKNFILVMIVGFVLVGGVIGVVDLNDEVTPEIEKKNFVGSLIENYYSLNNEPAYSNENSIEERPSYKGYLIEYDNPPILKKKTELEEKAKSNEKSFWNNFLTKGFIFTSDKVPREVEKYSDSLKTANLKTKEKILGELQLTQKGKSSEQIILSEHDVAFNGIALDIGDEEAKQLEDIEGVKRVVPNYEVKAMLMDSVPLIQDGIPAGQVDRNGNDCTISGEECWTGEGVTIGIIDTGVDYTHEDLGGCLGFEGIILEDDDVCMIDGICQGVEFRVDEGQTKSILYEGNNYEINVKKIESAPYVIKIDFSVNDENFYKEFLSGNEEDFIFYLSDREFIHIKQVIFKVNFDNEIYEVEKALIFSIGENDKLCPNDCLEKLECKVAGGYDFSDRDGDPMDSNGHGTHVAATAAGNGVLKGVAPDADIYAYKVFPNSANSVVIQAIERSMDPNQDGDYSDHLDIISLSLGLDCSWYEDNQDICSPDDPVSLAIDNVVDNGVVAVVAAGNDGPREQTIGSPGTARKAITVGASYKKDYPNFFITCEANSFLPEHTGANSFCGSNYNIESLIFENFPNGKCGNDGKALCTYWNSHPRVNQIVSFSSRGPVIWRDENHRQKGIVKPDIVAPGAIICASRFESIFSEGEHIHYKPCIDEYHVQIAGTSMSAPIISGVVALIKQKHPDWTPEEIKSSLKSTTIDLIDPATGESYSPMIQGAGRVDVNRVLMLDKPSEFIDYDNIYLNLFQPVKGYYVFEENKGNKIIIEGLFNKDYERIEGRYRLNDEDYWRTEGLEIVGEENKVFIFDVNSIYSEIIDSEFVTIEFEATIYKEDRFLMDKIDFNIIYDGKGWPKFFDYPGYSSFLAEDFDKDGSQEILVVAENKLLIFNSNAEIIHEKSLDLSLKNIKNPKPSIIDLNNDGLFEIIIFGQESDSIKSNAIIYLLDDKLNLIGSRVLNSNIFVGFADGAYLITEDIDLDGKKQIISFSIKLEDSGSFPFSPYIHIFDDKLNLIKELQTEEGTQGLSTSPAIGNFDDDTELEIVFQSINAQGDISFKILDDGELITLMGSNLNLEGEQVPPVDNNIITADLNYDGKQEFIFSSEGKIEVIDVTGKSSWRKGVQSHIYRVVMGDILGDLNPEIILIAKERIFVFDSKGNQLWKKDLEGKIVDSDYRTSLVKDIDGDGKNEIIIIDGLNYNGPEIIILDSNGEIIRSIPLEKYIFDGILVNEGGKNLFVINRLNMMLDVIDLNTKYNPSKMDWPQFQHDPQHTGCYDCQKTQLIKSKITNSGSLKEGILSFNIEQKVSGNWNLVASNSKENVIGQGESVELAPIFAELYPNLNLVQTGQYRVKVEYHTFTNGIFEKTYESTHEFEVVN